MTSLHQKYKFIEKCEKFLKIDILIKLRGRWIKIIIQLSSKNWQV